MKPIQDKIYKNALLAERFIRLDKKERQQIITSLLTKYSERELGEQLGISHSTIHDWKTLRQDNTEENIHISLSAMIRKLENFKPKTAEEFMKLEQIKKIVTRLLEVRQ